MLYNELQKFRDLQILLYYFGYETGLSLSQTSANALLLNRCSSFGYYPGSMEDCRAVIMGIEARHVWLFQPRYW